MYARQGMGIHALCAVVDRLLGAAKTIFLQA
jgi:hypothetical protein